MRHTYRLGVSKVKSQTKQSRDCAEKPAQWLVAAQAPLGSPPTHPGHPIGNGISVLNASMCHAVIKNDMCELDVTLGTFYTR